LVICQNINWRLLTTIAVAELENYWEWTSRKGVDLTVGSRQKHRGMSWSPKGSKALCLLKVAELNGQWQQLWFPAQQA
jgi:hypothetical protein